jgi:hypothetical protein
LHPKKEIRHRHRATIGRKKRGRAAGNRVGAKALNRETKSQEAIMGFGRGALLWLIGVPLPIIILLAIFWHN